MVSTSRTVFGVPAVSSALGSGGWCAWSAPHTTSAERALDGGDREAVRRQSVARALEGLITHVWIDERGA